MPFSASNPKPGNPNQGDAPEFAAPVLAVCGCSGSGKTTLLEAAIPVLLRRGLAVAVVKHASHGFEVDRAGKDSDRLFRAGATVSLRGPAEQFERRASPLSLEVTLARLACDHDLLLVEGHKETPLPKLWLASAGEPAAPAGLGGLVAAMPWQAEASGDRRLAALLEYIDRWLPQAWSARPLRRGLLIGGSSTRMGSPKQMLRFGERSLGEIAAAALAAPPSAPPLALLGSGELPAALHDAAQLHKAVCLPDAAGFAGPGAALLAAHRWAPAAAWIVAACDHPWLRAEHIEWLAAERRPGCWAVVPAQRDGHPCPTLALYEPQALEAMERMALADPRRNPSPAALLSLPQSVVVSPPEELADGWCSVNTPEELSAEEKRLAEDGRPRAK